MARTGWSTSNFLRYAGGVVTAVPFSMCARVYTDDPAVDQALVDLHNSASAFNRDCFILAIENSSARFICGSDVGSTNATTTADLSANTWHFLAGVGVSATSRFIYLDNTEVVEATTSRIPVGINRASLGVKDVGTPASSLNAAAYLAEVGIWNAALTAAEVSLLAKGFSPLLVRPASLVAYWPLWGRSSPEINYLDNAAVQSVQGTLTAAPHPRVIMPKTRLFRPDYTVAVVAGQPTWKRFGGVPFMGGPRTSQGAQVW